MRRILVIDGSRVVRATLAKRLQGDFELLEEGNGEFAWQTLMLDANIDLVISGMHPPKLSALELISRLRGSSIRRLNAMPVALIVSDIESAALDLPEIIRHEVACFITKSMSKVDMAARLQECLPCAHVEDTAQTPPPIKSTSNVIPLRAIKNSDRYLNAQAFANAIATFELPDAKIEPVSVMLIAVSQKAENGLCGELQNISLSIQKRIAKLLEARIEADDLLGSFSNERIAIVSRGVDMANAMRFARKVCKSLAQGHVTIGGQHLKLGVTVGVSCSSDDRVERIDELLTLAEARVNQAIICGENSVVTALKPNCPVRCESQDLMRLADFLEGRARPQGAAEISSMGVRLLPFLRAMDKELALGLPLVRIEQKLKQCLQAQASREL